MFDVGFSELILVFVIGLLILGPERLPRVAAQIGRWVARARRTANQLRHQLEREMALDEINRNKKPPTRPKPAERKPPGDETAGASHSNAPSPASGDASDSAQSSSGDHATVPLPGDHAAVASSAPETTPETAPETAHPVGSAPEVDTRVAETEETSTSNS